MNKVNENITSIVIQARMGSTRLPGKSFMSIDGTKIIEWVISTCKCVSGIDKIILATSEDKNCDCLEEIALKEKIEIIRGSENNVLKRFIDAINKFQLKTVIRITADDICHDPSFIEYGLRTFEKEKSNYLISHTQESPLIDGLIYEIFDSDLLVKVSEKKDLSEKDKEHVTTYIREKKINFKLGKIDSQNIPNLYKEIPDIKLCIDTLEDYKLINSAWCSKNYNGKLIGDTKKIIENLNKLRFKN